jgi:hypothetical protein
LYVLNVCMLLHATLSSWWVGLSYFTKTTCTCLLIWEAVGASVRLVHPRISRTWLKLPVANCFATDRYKAVTHWVLFLVICLWCLFWNSSFYYTYPFFPLDLLAVWWRCVFWMWPFLICTFHLFCNTWYLQQLFPICTLPAGHSHLFVVTPHWKFGTQESGLRLQGSHREEPTNNDKCFRTLLFLKTKSNLIFSLTFSFVICVSRLCTNLTS